VSGDTIETFRASLAAREPVYGVWAAHVGVASTVAARSGADYVVLDLQHGDGSETDVPAFANAAVAAGALPLVRTRSAAFADIGRVLDLGAHGVIVPNILGAEHAREVIAATRYGPTGTRSFGRLVGDVEHPIVLLLIESAGALEQLDDILALDGFDGLYVGGRDLALSLDRAAKTRHMDKVITDILRRSVAANTPIGVHSPDGAGAAKYAAAGATILTAGADGPLLEAAFREQLATARRSQAQ
jgi:4-hydroxy-2-oxoheptanedioate aldolase